MNDSEIVKEIQKQFDLAWVFLGRAINSFSAYKGDELVIEEGGMEISSLADEERARHAICIKKGKKVECSIFGFDEKGDPEVEEEIVLE